MPDALKRGRRVHLRLLAPEDEREYLLRFRASKRLHRPWSHPPTTSAAFRELVSDGSGADARLVICRNDDGAIVGYFGLGQIFYGHFRNAYLGYYAFVPHAGTGAMRAAMRHVFRFSFGELGLHRLQANVQPGNARSIELLRATGWREEGFARRYLKIGGRWRDHIMFAILAEDVGASGRRRP
jgi:[ribosomal protein S5]-alanine N-acetyltransferase